MSLRGEIHFTGKFDSAATDALCVCDCIDNFSLRVPNLTPFSSGKLTTKI